MLVLIDRSWCCVMSCEVHFVRCLGTLRAVVMVVKVVTMVFVFTMVVRMVGRVRCGGVMVVRRDILIVIWLLRIAEPWSVAQGARFEYLRDGVFYEVTIRLRICWIRWFIIILVLVTRFLFCIVIILIFIIIIVFTGRITKSIAVTRVVLHTPVHISPT